MSAGSRRFSATDLSQVAAEWLALSSNGRRLMLRCLKRTTRQTSHGPTQFTVQYSSNSFALSCRAALKLDGILGSGRGACSLLLPLRGARSSSTRGRRTGSLGLKGLAALGRPTPQWFGFHRCRQAAVGAVPQPPSAAPPDQEQQDLPASRCQWSFLTCLALHSQHRHGSWVASTWFSL